jgi:large subunit ribosomal protein L22
MEAKAILRFVRVAPRKARLVVDLIRGKNAAEALTILKFTPRHAAKVVEKILKSAVANAAQKEMGDVDALWVSKVCVDGGPTMKRMQPRAMGRANTIRKRTSHITLILSGETLTTKPKVARTQPKPKTAETKPAAAKKTTAKKASADKPPVSDRPKKAARPKKKADTATETEKEK